MEVRRRSVVEALEIQGCIRALRQADLESHAGQVHGIVVEDSSQEAVGSYVAAEIVVVVGIGCEVGEAGVVVGPEAVVLQTVSMSVLIDQELSQSNAFACDQKEGNMEIIRKVFALSESGLHPKCFIVQVSGRG